MGKALGRLWEEEGQGKESSGKGRIRAGKALERRIKTGKILGGEI